MSSAPAIASLARYEVRFRSLFDHGRALTFPCDEKGCVEIDRLSERARLNYLYARAVVGREYAAPLVMAAACDGQRHAV